MLVVSVVLVIHLASVITLLAELAVVLGHIHLVLVAIERLAGLLRR